MNNDQLDHFPSGMPRQLTPAQISEAKECFSIYGRDGRIPIRDVGNALRSLGINPSNSEIAKVIQEIGSPPFVNFETFMVCSAGKAFMSLILPYTQQRPSFVRLGRGRGY